MVGGLLPIWILGRPMFLKGDQSNAAEVAAL